MDKIATGRANRVYVVLVNWNGWQDTIECLESLFQSDYPDFRVIVCDNGSTDGSLEQLKKWAGGLCVFETVVDSPLSRLNKQIFPKPVKYSEYSKIDAESGGDLDIDSPLVFIDCVENLGFAGGNNVGMRFALARGDFSYIWLLNNDTVVESSALIAMVRRMREKPEAGMCGSALFYYHRPEKVQALGGGWHCKWIGLPWHYGRFNGKYDADNSKKAEAWMNYVEGASMLVSRDFLLDIGLMCEDYFLFFEETDWAIRAMGRYTLAYSPKSIVYHKVGGSIGTSSNPLNKSYNCDYFNVKNRLFFTARYYPYSLPTVYLALSCTFFSRLFYGKWDRAKMIVHLFKDHFITEKNL